LRRDDTQDHLSGDIKIRSIADVTAEAIAPISGAGSTTWRRSPEAAVARRGDRFRDRHAP